MRAAKKPAEPKFTALLRAPPLPPPAAAAPGEEVRGVGVGVGLTGTEEILLAETKEREEPGARLTELEESKQAVANRIWV